MKKKITKILTAATFMVMSVSTNAFAGQNNIDISNITGLEVNNSGYGNTIITQVVTNVNNVVNVDINVDADSIAKSALDGAFKNKTASYADKFRHLK